MTGVKIGALLLLAVVIALFLYAVLGLRDEKLLAAAGLISAVFVVVRVIMDWRRGDG